MFKILTCYGLDQIIERSNDDDAIYPRIYTKAYTFKINRKFGEQNIVFETTNETCPQYLFNFNQNNKQAKLKLYLLPEQWIPNKTGIEL